MKYNGLIFMDLQQSDPSGVDIVSTIPLFFKVPGQLVFKYTVIDYSTNTLEHVTMVINENNEVIDTVGQYTLTPTT